MRLFIKTALVLWTCLLTGWIAVGQIPNVANVSVERFSVEHGLTSRDVNHFTKDKQGFLWVATYRGLSRFDGYSFLNFDSRPQNPFKIRFNKIEYLYVDRSGKLIINYDDGRSQLGAFDMLNPLTGQLQVLQLEQCRNKIHTLYQGQDKMLYFLIVEGKHPVLYQYDEKAQGLVKVFTVEPSLVASEEPAGMFKSVKGHYWFAFLTESAGLKVVETDGSGHTLETYSLEGGYSKVYGIANTFRLAETSDGFVWLVTGNTGLYKLEPSRDKSFKLHAQIKEGAYVMEADARGNFLVYQSRPKKPEKGCFLLRSDGKLEDYNFVFQHQSIIDQVFSDDFTQWFVAGSFNGFNKYHLQSRYFDAYLAKELGNEPFGISTRGMTKIGPNKLYISTESHGLFELDVKSGKINKPGDRLPHLEPLNHHQYSRSMIAEGDSVLYMAVVQGIVKYQPNANRYAFYKVPGIDAWGLTFGKDGFLWAAIFNGMLVRMDPRTGAYTQYLNKDGTNPIHGCVATYLFCAKDGTLWVGTTLFGLININTVTGEVRRFSANPGDPTGLKSNHITCIYENDAGMFWIGTLESGLHLFDPHKGRVTAVYSREDGLGHYSVASMLPDQSGNLWVSTFSGLSYFDVKKKTFNNYTVADGLSYNEFNRLSSYYDKENRRFYFGGMNGVNAFNEKDLRPVENHAQLLISEVSYQNASDSTVAIHTGIVDGSTFTLPPGNGSIYIRLALDAYASSPRNLFSYKIEELNNHWIHLGTETELRINHLPAGSYTLHLRGADNRGNWSSDSITLHVVVKEFWFRSWQAILLYAGMFLMAGFFFYRFQLKKRIAEKEAHRLQELDVFKSRLFTNISHEFRTPLTVILGTTDHLIRENQQKIQHSTSSFSMVRRNGERLLLLVNQILDLAKLESNTLKLDNIQADVLPYTRYIVESLHSYAGSQNVDLNLEISEKEMVMDYDPERLLQIVNNLLTNAIKFTPTGGKVTFQVGLEQEEAANKTPQCMFVVTDTGAGIPAEDLPFIFDRFYQANNLKKANTGGTGIGLALTKELVQLMGGQINVESEEGKGSRFVVTLPIKRSAPKSEITLEPKRKVEVASANIQLKAQGQLPSLLLIEDNPDVVEYLVSCLQGTYRIDVAYNGDSGISKALETVPDLIVSDVMMPGKDGFEVCDVLKNDVLTSHIPLVLLTARADVESKLDGLRRGADAYLAKPFLRDELLVTLENLLSLRRKMQSKFADLHVASGEVMVEDLNDMPDLIQEQTFVQQVQKAVEENMANASFSVEKLCQVMAMSQPQLHRKLTALTGKNATQFIRSMRLARAKVLLEQKEKSVSQVAYEVGFDDPKYFSRVFSETFGIAPSKV